MGTKSLDLYQEILHIFKHKANLIQDNNDRFNKTFLTGDDSISMSIKKLLSASSLEAFTTNYTKLTLTQEQQKALSQFYFATTHLSAESYTNKSNDPIFKTLLKALSPFSPKPAYGLQIISMLMRDTQGRKSINILHATLRVKKEGTSL